MTCQSLICGVRSVSTVILGSKCVSEGHDAPSMRPAHTPCPSDRQVRLRQWLGRTTHTTSRFERPGPIRILAYWASLRGGTGHTSGQLSVPDRCSTNSPTPGDGRFAWSGRKSEPENWNRMHAIAWEFSGCATVPFV